MLSSGILSSVPVQMETLQAAVELRHIPDAAAVDAVGVVIGGVVEQAVGIRDLGKALFRVGGDQQAALLLPVAASMVTLLMTS